MKNNGRKKPHDMIDHLESLASRPGWRRVSDGTFSLALAGYFRERKPGKPLTDVQLLAALVAKVAAPHELPAWLDGLDGLGSFIFMHPDGVVAAVDPVRSVPIVYATLPEGGALVSADAPALAQKLGLGPKDGDPDQLVAFAASGFTIGNRTLYKAIKPLPAGHFVRLENNVLTVQRYHKWQPWQVQKMPSDALVKPLAAMHEKLIESLIASAAGRLILVPLSAGLDSRFIASGLKAAGYDNVRCFAYGQSGNREAMTSRTIAKRLGYDWTFLPYSQRRIKEAWHSDDHKAFWRFADTLSAVPFPQEYVALRQLRAKGWLDDDPIIVNGQTGDFISGNHVPKASVTDSADKLAPDQRLQRLLDGFIAKHFKLWRGLQQGASMNRVRGLLKDEIAVLGGMRDDPATDHGLYEYCEFQDRQSKYVIAGQRVYDWFGLDWRLPFWERPCLDFWARAPLNAKQQQSLYRSVLKEINWAGAWQDVPINPTRIRPAWMVPVRMVLKALHAPLGRDRWHRFERQYLDYWMAPLCHYAPWSWWQVARDRRGHGSPISWYVADYLEAHGWRWDGQMPTVPNSSMER